ncbi:hypothetical protein C8T65DRAFT_652622 [Cerioporus squamosus]|nr:hypothetical protein C8T65DRAFT_652622 [Cerioporus squamosus]
MKDGKQRAKHDTSVPSGRGTYAKQACSHCRKRKSKCDGRTPVCGPCEKAGRASECTWGKETAKKARTQQHFESLENYIRALEAKVKDLQADLENCRRNHGGPSPAASSDAARDPSLPRPDSVEVDISTDGGNTSSSNSDSDIDTLISPTKHLLLQDTDLEFHGPTSVWRLGAQRSSPATTDAKGSASPEPSHTVPSAYFDWSRHLPHDVPLTRAEHDRILDIMLKFCQCWSLRIIPELFLRDMHRALSLPPTATPPRAAHYSPMLHNAALALATAFTDDPAVKDIRCRRMFASKAKSYIEPDAQKPTIALVTGLGTLALFHSTCGEQSLGYLYFGMAGRVSQALGLKTDCSSWVKSGLITEADMYDRNWAYWSIYSQDILWSLYVGRECSLVPHKKERQFPVPYVGSEIDNNAWFWAPSKMPPQPSYIVRTFAASCDLMVISRRIFDFLNSLGTGSKREGALQIVSELDIQLNNWKDSLAPEVDLTAASRPNALPHRLMLHLAYWWTLLLLHRPFYRRTKSAGSGPEIDHVKLCNRASDNIMLLLGIWHEKYTLRYLPITLMQVIYCAGTSFILSAVQATSGPRLGRVALTTALSQAEQCIRYLLIAGKSFECANEVANILSNLLHEQLRPRLLMRTLEPKDILPRSASQESPPKVEYSQYPGVAGPSNGVSSSEAAADAQSLATTITNLDALHDQCRFTLIGNSSYSPDWNPREGVTVFPLSQQASTSTSSPVSALYNPHFPMTSDGLSRIPEDVDMEFGLGGMDMSMMSGQPLSNRPYMSFGLPEFAGLPPGTGYPDVDAPPFNPNTQMHQQQRQASSASQVLPQAQPQVQAQARAQGQSAPLHLDFSADELAMMDQIMRQQFNQQGMNVNFGMQAQQPRFDPLQ